MRLVTVLVTLLLIVHAASAGEITGRVIAIVDGDTCDLETEEKVIRVRLAGIDTPEPGQPFCDAARRRLRELVMGKDVTVSHRNQRHRKRLIVTMRVGEILVNQQLIDDGLAWHDRRYRNDGDYHAGELDARLFGAGLWADKDPIPPWEWRRGRRSY